MLPGGREVTVRFGPAEAAAEADDGSLASAARVLRTDGVIESDPSIEQEPLSIEQAHVLRVLLLQRGVLREQACAIQCENCDASYADKPSRCVELAPFLSGDLTDPELDRPFDFQAEHTIPAFSVDGRVVRTVKLAPRDLSDAAPLWERAPVDPFATRVELALCGIVQVGKARKSSQMARWLRQAPSSTRQALVQLLRAAHHPPRLEGQRRCDACGEVIRIWPIPPSELREQAREEADVPTMSLDDFEELVRELAPRVYRRMGVRAIGLHIEGGPADTDDGGEPLLGAYVPGGTDAAGLERGPEITLYYRTFCRQLADDPSFDVRHEVYETLEHEVQHHLYYLEGDDPMDDDERFAIEEQAARRVGSKEAKRRAATASVRGFGQAIVALGPLLIIFAAVIAWYECGAR